MGAKPQYVPMHGAVGIVDALGWKGIWRQHPPSAVLDALQQLQEAATESREELSHAGHEFARTSNLPELTLQTKFFSDSIVVSAGAVASDASPLEIVEAMALSVIGIAVMNVQGAAAKLDTPFAYRGAVAVGPYWCADSAIVGAAIDEAAAGMDEPMASLVWLVPQSSRLGRPQSPVWFEHQVPLRTGTIRAHVVNPLALADDMRSMREALLAPMSGTGAFLVELKRTHTAVFLDAAQAARLQGP